MKEAQLAKLRELPEETWTAALAKCYTHVKLQLWDKTTSGAHHEQRLGMPAEDYYVGQAIESLYTGRWQWKDEQFSIDEQLIRIIDSMISEQVRKYKVEERRGRKTILAPSDQLVLAIEDQFTDEDYDEGRLEQFQTALARACDKEEYKRFIQLKQEGCSYKEISKQMNCTRDEVYQMRETIARRAQKLLQEQLPNQKRN